MNGIVINSAVITASTGTNPDDSRPHARPMPAKAGGALPRGGSFSVVSAMKTPEEVESNRTWIARHSRYFLLQPQSEALRLDKNL